MPRVVKIKEYIKSDAITDVMILPGVTSIGDHAFDGCNTNHLQIICATEEQKKMLLAAGVNTDNIKVQTPETPSGSGCCLVM
jgi:hypothetical protein